MTPASPPSDGPPPRSKATLICQDCGRERHVDGGWRRRQADDHVAVVCPDCGHVLTRRPRELSERPEGPRADAVRAEGWRGRVRASLAPLSAGSRSVLQRLPVRAGGSLRDRLSLRD